MNQVYFFLNCQSGTVNKERNLINEWEKYDVFLTTDDFKN